jgi:hypothetical protein
MIRFIGLWYSAWRHFTVHCYTHTHTHTHIHVSIVTSSLAVMLSSGFNGGRSHSSGFLHYPRPELPASHSNCSQQLSPSSSLTNSVTHQQTNSTDFHQLTVLLIASRHGSHRKHRTIIAVRLLPWKHACLRSRYLAVAVVWMLFRGPCLATGLRATICYVLAWIASLFIPLVKLSL